MMATTRVLAKPWVPRWCAGSGDSSHRLRHNVIRNFYATAKISTNQRTSSDVIAVLATAKRTTNIPPLTMERIIDRARILTGGGKPAIRRIYESTASYVSSCWLKSPRKYPFDLVDTAHDVRHVISDIDNNYRVAEVVKQAEVQLAVDAMDILYENPKVNSFVLMLRDPVLPSLSKRLRKEGKTVILVDDVESDELHQLSNDSKILKEYDHLIRVSELERSLRKKNGGHRSKVCGVSKVTTVSPSNVEDTSGADPFEVESAELPCVPTAAEDSGSRCSTTIRESSPLDTTETYNNRGILSSFSQHVQSYIGSISSLWTTKTPNGEHGVDMQPEAQAMEAAAESGHDTRVDEQDMQCCESAPPDGLPTFLSENQRASLKAAIIATEQDDGWACLSMVVEKTKLTKKRLGKSLRSIVQEYPGEPFSVKNGRIRFCNGQGHC